MFAHVNRGPAEGFDLNPAGTISTCTNSPGRMETTCTYPVGDRGLAEVVAHAAAHDVVELASNEFTRWRRRFCVGSVLLGSRCSRSHATSWGIATGARRRLDRCSGARSVRRSAQGCRTDCLRRWGSSPAPSPPESFAVDFVWTGPRARRAGLRWRVRCRASKIPARAAAWKNM